MRPFNVSVAAALTVLAMVGSAAAQNVLIQAAPGARGDVTILNQNTSYSQGPADTVTNTAVFANVIKATATPQSALDRFKNWEGPAFQSGGPLFGSGMERDNPLTFYFLGGVYTITARFGAPPKIALTVNATSFGDVRIDNLTDATVSGPADTATDIAADSGDQIRITALRVSGYVFDRWSGDIPTGLQFANPATFASDGTDRNITAFFVAAPAITLSANVYADGDVQIRNNSDAITYGPGDSVTDPDANNGESITLTATPAPSRIFIQWTGSLPVGMSTTANPASFIQDNASHTITAVFGTPAQIIASVNSGPLGDVTLLNVTTSVSSGPGDTASLSPVFLGQTIRATATVAGPQYLFVQWVGDVPAGRQNDNPLVFTSDGLTKNLTAQFALPPANIQVSVDPGSAFPGAGTGNATILNQTTGVTAGPGNPVIIGCSAGNQIRITPNPSVGSVFYKWAGDITPGTDYLNPLQFVSAGANQNITVLFSNGDLDDDGMSDSWERAVGLNPESSAGNDGAGGDPDGDMLSNLEEYTGPVNGNPAGINGVAVFGRTNPFNADSDGDGMNDAWEAFYGLNPLSAAGGNGRNADVDSDGLRNIEEFLGADGIVPIGVGLDGDSTDPQAFDTDGDLLGDFWEIYWELDPLNPNDPMGAHHNQDADLLPAISNYVYTGVITNTVLGYAPSPDDPFDNLFEYAGLDLVAGTADDPGTDPKNPDSDGDGLPDGWEYFFWGNAVNNPAMVGRAYDPGSAITSLVIPNADIITWFNPTVLNSASGRDLDGDCMSNAEELLAGTDPIDWDTDRDGMPDGWEVQYLLDPLDPRDAIDNQDGDWMATAPGGVHWQVYTQNGYDPRTAWGGTYRVRNGAPQTNVNTRVFTALDEFRVVAFYIAMSAVGTNPPTLRIPCLQWPEYGTDPTTPDTDNDGMADGWELYVALDPAGRLAAVDASIDLDRDGLTNVEEFRCFGVQEHYPTVFPVLDPTWQNKFWPTNPRNNDTDDDQTIDGDEQTTFNWANGAGVWNNECFEGGGLNPTTVDTDRDFLPDNWEAYFANTAAVGQPRNSMEGTIADNGGDGLNDYDGDGLMNYQEYMANAVYHWQYDGNIPPSWSPGRGFGGYDPIDFFYPPYGKNAYGWDWNYWAYLPRGNVYYFITSRIPGLAGPRTGGISVGGDYSCTYPDVWDTDADRMDDFYETYHGLNPLWGTADTVHANIAATVPSGLDIRLSPFQAGSQLADPDQDGLTNDKESLDPTQPDPMYYHSDPSPLWVTDHSYELSWVNLYYWLGTFAYHWYWSPSSWTMSPFTPPPPILNYAPPAYVYSFEENEGFDSDNDNVADHDDLVGTDIDGTTDPIDDELPIKRRALYLNSDAACRTRGIFYHGPTELQNFTVEVWVRSEQPAMGREQVILERPIAIPNNNPMGWLNGIRLTFRVGLTATGVPFVKYNGDGYDPTTVDPEVFGPTALQANRWYHLAGVYSGTDQKLKLFIGGDLAASIPSSLIPVNGWFNGNPGWAYPGPVVVGARDKNPDGYVSGKPILVGPVAYWYPYPTTVPNEPDLDLHFKGWIDEIRVWDGARSQDQIRTTMVTRLKRATAAAMITSYPTLLYHYTFDNLPDPDYDPVSPPGFEVLNGRPNDGSYSQVPWWGTAKDRSLVYDEYHYVPWIENTMAHYAKDPPKDSPFWPMVVVDTNGVVLGTNVFYNSSDPYGFGYETAVLEVLADHPDYLTDSRLRFNAVTAQNVNDLLPLRYAKADEDVDMWDGLGAGTNTTYDTDGDSLPDLWEIRYGLDPYSPNGDDGMNGDPDNDGLKNYAEYLADTDPMDFDTDGDGFGDFDSIPAGGNRTFGDLYTDADGMDDAWEVLYPQACSPLVYDAHLDADGDGWSNFGEFQEGTDPSDYRDFPEPDAYFHVDYSGVNYAGNLIINAYSRPTMDGEPDAIYDPGALPAIIVTGEPLSASGLPFYSLQLNNDNIVPQTLIISDANHAVIDVGLGTLIGTWPGSGGTINYGTGDITLNYSNRPPAGFLMTANYAYRDIQTTYPVDLFYTNAWNRHIKEGANYFFAFIDQNANSTFDQGEPAGLGYTATRPQDRAAHKPVMVGWNRFKVNITLSDSLPGYGRFTWLGGGTVDSAVTVRRLNSTGQPVVLSRNMRAPRNYLHEGDFRMSGQFGVDPGGLRNPLYQWVVTTTMYGIFTNNYSAVPASPQLVSPLGAVVKYAQNDFEWIMEPNVTLFEIEIANAATPMRPLYTGKYVPPHRNADGKYRFTLPWFANEGALKNGAYVWRVRGISPIAVGAWSGFGRFDVNLQNTVQGAHSIGGTLYYFGVMAPPSIVVQAFVSPGFSDTPVAQITLPAKGPFRLLGLRAGQYYVRAFIDQNANKVLDSFEAYGFIKNTSGAFATDYAPGALTVPLNIDGRQLVIRDVDTDNDGLPDGWEVQKFGNLSVAGPGTPVP